jgi:hypothetical protein
MDITIVHVFRSETIMFRGKYTEFSEWHGKDITHNDTYELTKTISGDRISYSLVANRFSLDNESCISAEENGETHWNNMINTPTGKLLLEQMKDKFTI